MTIATELALRAARIKLATLTGAAYPGQPPGPPQVPVTAMPRAPHLTPTPPAPGMFAGLASTLKSPQTVAGLIGHPMLQKFTRPLLGVGGMPLLAGVGDLALHGGRNIAALTRGRIGGPT